MTATSDLNMKLTHPDDRIPSKPGSSGLKPFSVDRSFPFYCGVNLTAWGDCVILSILLTAMMQFLLTGPSCSNLG